MKNSAYIFLLILFSSCIIGQAPKDFSYKYDGAESGLEKMIDTDGYYIFERGCDSTFFTLVLFYTDGLCMITQTNNRDSSIGECMLRGGESNICNYISWATYRVEGNIIKTQTHKDEGLGKCTIFRDFEIQKDGSLINSADYVIAQNTNLGYMKNYPSFVENPCRKAAEFYPSQHKRNKKECTMFTKKWFSEKP